LIKKPNKIKEAKIGGKGMLRGLYNASTAMQVESARLDTIANNLANAQTVGYKKDKMVSQSFPEVLTARLKNDPNAQIKPYNIIGTINHGVHIDQVKTDWGQGPLQQTENPTDLALFGNGFFVVRTGQNAIQYTRDGSFAVDAAGYLVDSNGNRVQAYDNAGFRDINVGGSDFTVDLSGNVYNVQNQYVGTMAVVDFYANNPATGQLEVVRDDALEKVGDNLYVVYDNQNYQPTPVATTIKQGYRETSNVDLNEEITNMMEVYRHYESAQRIASMIDQTLDKTVNEVGKV